MTMADDVIVLFDSGNPISNGGVTTYVDQFGTAYVYTRPETPTYTSDEFIYEQCRGVANAPNFYE